MHASPPHRNSDSTPEGAAEGLLRMRGDISEQQQQMQLLRAQQQQQQQLMFPRQFPPPVGRLTSQDGLQDWAVTSRFGSPVAERMRTVTTQAVVPPQSLRIIKEAAICGEASGAAGAMVTGEGYGWVSPDATWMQGWGTQQLLQHQHQHPHLDQGQGQHQHQHHQLQHHDLHHYVDLDAHRPLDRATTLGSGNFRAAVSRGPSNSPLRLASPGQQQQQPGLHSQVPQQREWQGLQDVHQQEVQQRGQLGGWGGAERQRPHDSRAGLSSSPVWGGDCDMVEGGTPGGHPAVQPAPSHQQQSPALQLKQRTVGGGTGDSDDDYSPTVRGSGHLSGKRRNRRKQSHRRVTPAGGAIRGNVSPAPSVIAAIGSYGVGSYGGYTESGGSGMMTDSELGGSVGAASTPTALRRGGFGAGGAGGRRTRGPCANCGTFDTILWRRDPTDTSLFLCNACGIYVSNSSL